MRALLAAGVVIGWARWALVSRTRPSGSSARLRAPAVSPAAPSTLPPIQGERREAGVRRPQPLVAPARSIAGRVDTEKEEPIADAASSVSGRVVDATGGWIPRARLTLHGVGENSSVSAQALSDDEGRFRLHAPAGSVELSARAEGYSTVVQQIEAPVSDLTVQLVPSAGISGHVMVEGTGEPIRGASVTAINRDGFVLPAVTSTTAADGSFTLPSLGTGGYTVSASAEGWQTRDAWVVLGVSDTADLRLALSRAGNLSATISVGGEPCASGSVLLSGTSILSAVPDVRGALQLTNIPPGPYAVTVRCKDALPRKEALSVALGTPLVKHWTLESGLTLRGTVQHANGLPFAHASVTALPVNDPAPGKAPAGADDDRDSPDDCAADDTGAFACAGLSSGAYEVSISGDPASARSVTLAPSGDASVALKASGSATLRVRVGSSTSRRNSVIVLATDLERGSELQATPVRSEFVFDDMKLGRYRIYLGSSDAAGSVVAVERDGDVLELELPYPAEHMISGHVVDGRGNPLPDAWVSAASQDDRRRFTGFAGERALTDTSGAFRLPGLFDGQYEITANSARGEAKLAAVASGVSDLVVRIPSYGSLDGTARRPDGTPVPRFSLSYAADGAETTTIAGYDGHWAIAWLAPGRYAIDLSSDFGEAHAQAVLDESGAASPLIDLTVSSAWPSRSSRAPLAP